jgi:Xaa-Pro aminopeptidase
MARKKNASPVSVYQRRRQKVARALKAQQVDGLLVTDFTNVTYLTGFTGDDSFLLVTPEVHLLISDSRYTEQIADECSGIELLERGTGETMSRAVERAVKKVRLSRVAVEAASMTLGLFEKLSAALPRVNLVSCGGIVEQFREIKDREEIAEIRRAVWLAEKSFGVVRAALRGDQTEREIAYELERQIRLMGGAGNAFDPIVAAGPRAALPHAQPTSARIGDHDLLLVDWGATDRLYRSDLTRVLVTAKISPKLERIYGVVLKAQRQAIAAIRPGASMNAVDAAARRVIADAGFGKHFGHGLGHGFGLEIHEAPRLAPGQDRPLKAGMVVTVEPGIYLSKWGGVRIEDDVLVTRAGHEVLSNVPKELADCVVDGLRG